MEDAAQSPETVGADQRHLTRKRFRDDIRVVFDVLSDAVLLDDHQVAVLAGRSTPTIKRWRREGKTPPIIHLNGLPRYRVGDIREWLLGDRAATVGA